MPTRGITRCIVRFFFIASSLKAPCPCVCERYSLKHNKASTLNFPCLKAQQLPITSQHICHIRDQASDLGFFTIAVTAVCHIFLWLVFLQPFPTVNPEYCEVSGHQTCQFSGTELLQIYIFPSFWSSLYLLEPQELFIIVSVPSVRGGRKDHICV